MPDHSGNIQPQLDLEEHAHLAKAKRVTIVGTDGINYYEAKVNSSGELATTGGGGGGGGTVDQGTGGVSPWLVKIDQTGTNNDVDVVATVGLTDTELRATPVPVSGTVTIQDGGNVITVDGTVAVSNQNTQYTEGDVDATITGTAVMGETSGNVLTPIQIDANGAVKVVGHNGSLATNDASNLSDNTGFTDGSSFVSPAGFIFDETPGTALTENDAAAARIDSKRAIINVIEDATTRGQRAAVSSGGALSVDTELPAAAALSDALANPTTPQVGADYLRWDGTQWTRAQLYFYQNRTGAGTGAGAGTAIDMLANPMSKYTLQIENGTGTTSAWNVNLEGSMDNASWFTIVNQTSATGAITATFKGDSPARYCRSNVVSVTGGGTVRIRILATEH